VSAAAAVSWELRCLGRHQGRQRCCQENAWCCVGPPDETGSQGTSADVKVAVVSNSWSVCGDHRGGASVRRDETANRDRRPASGSLPTLSSWEWLKSQPERSRATSRSLTPSPRGYVRWAFEPSAEPGRRRSPSDRHTRPSEQHRPGKESGGRSTARTIRGVRPPCCVDFVCHCSVVCVVLPLNWWFADLCY